MQLWAIVPSAATPPLNIVAASRSLLC